MLNIFPGLLLLFVCLYAGLVFSTSENGHIEEVWYHNITEKDLRHGAKPDGRFHKQVFHYLDEFVEVASEGDDDKGND